MSLSLPLQDFVQTATQLTARELPLPRLIDHLRPEFERLLACPDLLDPTQEQPGAASYAQHVLHVDDAGRFCLVALVWRPNDRTPVHDHLAWGLAGVYRGHERETRYAWHDRSGGQPALRPVDVRYVAAGQVIPILPPADVHRVENPDPTTTVSLHLYGFDLRTAPRGSSVRRVYGPELLVGEVPNLVSV